MGICKSSTVTSTIIRVRSEPGNLPLEIWTKILPFLSAEELCQLSLVCKQLYSLVFAHQRLNNESPTKIKPVRRVTTRSARPSFFSKISRILLRPEFQDCISGKKLSVEGLQISKLAESSLLGKLLPVEGNDLEQGLSIDFQDESYSISPLNLAAMQGHAQIVQYLLEQGSDATFKGEVFRDSRTVDYGPGALSCLVQAYQSSDNPFELFPKGDYEECFKILLPFSTLSISFEILGSPKLLEHYVSWISQELIDHTDSEGYSMLERAILRGHNDSAKLLCRYARKISSKIFSQCSEELLSYVLPIYNEKPSPAYIAVYYNKPHLLKALMDKHFFKLDLMESFENRFLMPMLARSKNVALLRTFQENNKILDLKEALLHNYEYPCLWYALPDKNMVQAVLDITHDASVLPATETLYKFYNDFSLIELLIKYGMDVNKIDQSGNPIVWHLYMNKKIDVIAIVLRFNCDINAKNSQGITILHDACLNKSRSLIKNLLNLGADFSLTTSRGYTCKTFLGLNSNLRNSEVQDILKTVNKTYKY